MTTTERSVYPDFVHAPSASRARPATVSPAATLPGDLDGAAVVARGLIENVSQVVLGKRDRVALIVAGLLSGGHVLVEDSPGVGKTVLARSLAASIGVGAGRVQGTADLLPTDITGVTVYDQATGHWRFRPGPLFHHVVLVDEINRATPRAQSALLQAMAEGYATVDGVNHPLPQPFFVIATQNPLGDVGTFPLVEGQLDRFTLNVTLGLPDRDSERALLRGVGGTGVLEHLTPVVDGAGLLAAIAAISRHVHTSDAVLDYVLDLATDLRARTAASRKGISPRANQQLMRVAKAAALVNGRDYVTPDDVQAVVEPVFAHRLGGGEGMASPGPVLVRDAVAATPVRS
jgi:MoxR-like ATPase